MSGGKGHVYVDSCPTGVYFRTTNLKNKNESKSGGSKEFSSVVFRAGIFCQSMVFVVTKMRKKT